MRKLLLTLLVVNLCNSQTYNSVGNISAKSVKVQELTGIGDRNVGVGSDGKLKIIPGGSGVDVTADHDKGLWNANLNTPTLVNGVGQIGDHYTVSFAGTALGYDFEPNDKVRYDGTIWRKDDFTSTLEEVLSFNGSAALPNSSYNFLDSYAEIYHYGVNGFSSLISSESAISIYRGDTSGDTTSVITLDQFGIGLNHTNPLNLLSNNTLYYNTNNLDGVKNRSLANVSGNELVTINGNFADVNGNLNIAVGGATNLTYTPSAANGIVNSDTGTDATIPLGDGTTAGLSLNDYTTAEKNKLASTPVTFFDGAYGSLTGIPSTFPPSAHGHVIADVTNLQNTIDAKVANDLTASTTVAPSKTAVNTALTLKYDASNPAGYISSVPAQSFASLTGKPTTLLGYGIVDAYPLAGNPSGFLTSFTEADPLALKISNNLSDLTNTTTARTNLGLGTLATQSGTFTAIPQGNITNLTTDLAGKLATNGNGSALTGLTGSQITGNITGNSANVTGTVSVANGGTGAITNTGVLIGNGTSPVTSVAGAANQFLRRNAGNTAYEFATIAGGGDAVIANGLQQFTGTTSTTFDISTEPATPPTNKLVLFSSDTNSHDVISYKGDDGIKHDLQTEETDGLVRKYFGITTNAIQAVNATGLTASGTGTASAIALTNKHTKEQGIDYLITVAATTALAGWRELTAGFWMGNVAGDGGFKFKCVFGQATGVATATHRLFVGMTTSTAAPSDAEPSTLTSMFGLAYDAADANMQIMHNDASGVATKIDLGANFVVPTTDRTALYEADFSCPPNSTTISYKIINMVTGNKAQGTFNTNIPAVNTLLSGRGWISAGGTSSVIGIAFKRMKIERSN